MKILMTALLLFICSINSLHAFETAVATVAKLVGSARVKMSSTGKIKELAENETVDEGDYIQTSERSLVKLKFNDDTQVIISPNTKFYINSFPKNEAGVFAVLRGEIRSIVSKKYPSNVEKNKSKLYLRTKTAVMGIRGTDFQLNYNPEDQNTSLITFHGKVAMNSLEEDGGRLTRDNMEELLSRRDAVFVEDGHASVVDRSFSRKIMKPVRINKEQFNTLKMSKSHLLDHFKEEHRQEKQPDEKQPDEKNKKHLQQVDGNGFMDKNSGEYRAPDGSLMDLEKSTIVPSFQKEMGIVNKDSGRANLQREKMEAAKEKFRGEFKQGKGERPEAREKNEKRQDKMERRPERQKPQRDGVRDRIRERLPTRERREERLPLPPPPTKV